MCGIDYLSRLCSIKNMEELRRYKAELEAELERVKGIIEDMEREGCE